MKSGRSADGSAGIFDNNDAILERELKFYNDFTEIRVARIEFAVSRTGHFLQVIAKSQENKKSTACPWNVDCWKRKLEENWNWNKCLKPVYVKV